MNSDAAPIALPEHTNDSAGRLGRLRNGGDAESADLLQDVIYEVRLTAVMASLPPLHLVEPCTATHTALGAEPAHTHTAMRAGGDHALRGRRPLAHAPPRAGTERRR